jgi:hypothetical protein
MCTIPRIASLALPAFVFVCLSTAACSASDAVGPDAPADPVEGGAIDAGAVGASDPEAGARPGDASGAADGGSVSPAECPREADLLDLEEHACLHASKGPFRDVVADNDGGALPDVSRVHTAFRIALGGAGEARVAYKPRRTAEYVFFTDAAASIAVRAADGGRIATTCSGAPFGTCAAFRSAAIVPLDAGVVYELTLTPTDRPATLTLIVEEREPS